MFGFTLKNSFVFLFIFALIFLNSGCSSKPSLNVNPEDKKALEGVLKELDVLLNKIRKENKNSALEIEELNKKIKDLNKKLDEEKSASAKTIDDGLKDALKKIEEDRNSIKQSDERIKYFVKKIDSNSADIETNNKKISDINGRMEKLMNGVFHVQGIIGYLQGQYKDGIKNSIISLKGSIEIQDWINANASIDNICLCLEKIKAGNLGDEEENLRAAIESLEKSKPVLINIYKNYKKLEKSYESYKEK